jgi:hypothetical protein
VRGASDGCLPPERFNDSLKNPFHILDYLIVPKAQNEKSLRSQPRRPSCVFRGRRGVLSAVEFNDKLALEADEIDDVPPNRRLTPDLAAGKLPVSQSIPEALLGFGLSKAQIAGAGGTHFVKLP